MKAGWEASMPVLCQHLQIFADIFFLSIAYLGSYRLIKSLEDKPALFIFGGMLMLAYGIISFINLKKEGKTNIRDLIIAMILENRFYVISIPCCLPNYLTLEDKFIHETNRLKIQR